MLHQIAHFCPARGNFSRYLFCWMICTGFIVGLFIMPPPQLMAQEKEVFNLADPLAEPLSEPLAEPLAPPGVIIPPAFYSHSPARLTTPSSTMPKGSPPKPSPPTVQVLSLGGIEDTDVGLSEGFGKNMWGATTRRQINQWLKRLPVTTSSPTVQDLRTELLLTKTPLPFGKSSINPFYTRLERLYAAGDSHNLMQLYRMLNTQAPPAVTIMATKVYLTEGKVQQACQLFKQARALPSYGKIMGKAENYFTIKMAIFCNLLQDNTASAELNLALLYEVTGSNQGFFYKTASAFLTQEKFPPTPPRYIDPLLWSLMQYTRYPLTEKATASVAMAVENILVKNIIFAHHLPPAQRLSGFFRALRGNLLPRPQQEQALKALLPLLTPKTLPEPPASLTLPHEALVGEKDTPAHHEDSNNATGQDDAAHNASAIKLAKTPMGKIILAYSRHKAGIDNTRIENTRIAPTDFGDTTGSKPDMAPLRLPWHTVESQKSNAPAQTPHNVAALVSQNLSYARAQGLWKEAVRLNAPRLTKLEVDKALPRHGAEIFLALAWLGEKELAQQWLPLARQATQNLDVKSLAVWELLFNLLEVTEQTTLQTSTQGPQAFNPLSQSIVQGFTPRSSWGKDGFPPLSVDKNFASERRELQVLTNVQTDTSLQTDTLPPKAATASHNHDTAAKGAVISLSLIILGNKGPATTRLVILRDVIAALNAAGLTAWGARLAIETMIPTALATLRATPRATLRATPRATPRATNAPAP